VIQANKVLPAIVAEVIRKAPLTDEKVAFAWRLAVGPAVGKATTVRLGANGTLYVRADAAAWNDAIGKSLGLIRSRLAHYLGEDAIQKVDFTSVP
jgi:hypothetical protein